MHVVVTTALAIQQLPFKLSLPTQRSPSPKRTRPLHGHSEPDCGSKLIGESTGNSWTNLTVGLTNISTLDWKILKDLKVNLIIRVWSQKFSTIQSHNMPQPSITVCYPSTASPLCRFAFNCTVLPYNSQLLSSLATPWKPTGPCPVGKYGTCVFIESSLGSRSSGSIKKLDPFRCVLDERLLLTVDPFATRVNLRNPSMAPLVCPATLKNQVTVAAHARATGLKSLCERLLLTGWQVPI